VLDLDSWQEVFSTLQKNLLRTLMTAWGIFWGTFMLVAMLGFGKGLEVGVQKNMLGFVANNVYAWGQITSKAHGGSGQAAPSGSTSKMGKYCVSCPGWSPSRPAWTSAAGERATT
jgi:hypothetical protein